MHILATTILYGGLAYHGLKKKSLSLSGAVAAAAVCFPTFSHPFILFMTVLLTFYLSSSKLTKVGTSTKKKLEEDFKEGGQRNAVQVFSNGFTGTVIACLHYMLVVHENKGSMEGLCFADSSTNWLSRLNTALLAAYIGTYACCNGDTWASELGVFSKSDPYLITTLRPVPKGTNGGISLIGTLASIAGGAVIGLIAALSHISSPCFSLGLITRLVVFASVCGFIGSMIDSVLGATLQRSTFNKKSGQITQDFRRLKKGEEKTDLVVVSGWEVLDNHQINFVSSLLTGVIAGVVALIAF
ncbi:Transmembrane protein 19 [Rhizoclosmatium hyalinum]|nr:Transmembrane protein 19 [Rhizoclosmatium hyalinum]